MVLLQVVAFFLVPETAKVPSGAGDQRVATALVLEPGSGKRQPLRTDSRIACSFQNSTVYVLHALDLHVHLQFLTSPETVIANALVFYYCIACFPL